jgi:hypothetical protein
VCGTVAATSESEPPETNTSTKRLGSAKYFKLNVAVPVEGKKKRKKKREIRKEYHAKTIHYHLCL